MKKAEVTAKYKGEVICPGVAYGPFGYIYFGNAPDGSYGSVFIPAEIGPLGDGAKLEVTFTVHKRGRLKRNPWHDGKSSRPKPSKYPAFCDAKGNIQG